MSLSATGLDRALTNFQALSSEGVPVQGVDLHIEIATSSAGKKGRGKVTSIRVIDDSAVRC
jgi:hypothetical protein